jgi:3,4-dihydroxy-2-butanone 4-phosphate synthase
LQGGVLRRTGHTEAASILPISRFQIGRVIVEIMNEDGSMARLPQLAKVAKKFDLKWFLLKRSCGLQNATRSDYKKRRLRY